MIVPGAVDLDRFAHPPRALYIFGPENGSLGKGVRMASHHFVRIPYPDPDERTPLNLAAAVNITLFTRMLEQRAWNAVSSDSLIDNIQKIQRDFDEAIRQRDQAIRQRDDARHLLEPRSETLSRLSQDPTAEQFWLVPNQARALCQNESCSEPDRLHPYATLLCRTVAVPDCMLQAVRIMLDNTSAPAQPAPEDTERFTHAFSCPNYRSQ